MQSLKLLLDENLSPKVAEWLRDAGIDAVHVRDRGLLEATDHDVLERAYAEDRVLITANVGDFLKLARARDLHAGIVVLDDGGLLRDEQLDIIRRAHEAILPERDMVNRVLRVNTDGKMTFRRGTSAVDGSWMMGRHRLAPAVLDVETELGRDDDLVAVAEGCGRLPDELFARTPTTDLGGIEERDASLVSGAYGTRVARAARRLGRGQPVCLGNDGPPIIAMTLHAQEPSRRGAA